MINKLKALTLILFQIILSFGIWYLIGVFISNEFNILKWWIIGKIIYIIFSISTLVNIQK